MRRGRDKGLDPMSCCKNDSAQKTFYQPWWIGERQNLQTLCSMIIHNLSNHCHTHTILSHQLSAATNTSIITVSNVSFYKRWLDEGSKSNCFVNNRAPSLFKTLPSPLAIRAHFPWGTCERAMRFDSCDRERITRLHQSPVYHQLSMWKLLKKKKWKSQYVWESRGMCCTWSADIL